MEKFFTKPSAVYVFTSAPVLARTLLHTSACLLLVKYEWIASGCIQLFYALLGSLLSLPPACLSVCLSVLTDRHPAAAIPLLSMQVPLPLCWEVLKPRPQVLAPPTSVCTVHNHHNSNHCAA